MNISPLSRDVSVLWADLIEVILFYLTMGEGLIVHSQDSSVSNI